MSESDAEPFQPCDQLLFLVGEEDFPLIYKPKYRQYGILYFDQRSYVRIEFCPFCGQKLPESLRDEYFARLEEMGLSLENAPPEMRTDEWWNGGTASNGKP